ncbi:MAG: sulfotransferase, partial [Bacteroidales bacterium]|nr:sulfotransferase [Bacteroidales bacterium]
IQIFGDKNPRYSKNPEKIIEIIPDAKIVHIVRDYRDHILSMKRVKLLYSNLAIISDIWRKSQKKIFVLKEKYPDSIISFRYEDFVKDPEQHLKKICGFLKIDYVPAVLNYTNKEEELKKANELKVSDVFHGNLFKPITADNVEKWKHKMTKRDIARADFYVGKYVELSGYQRQYPRRTITGFLYAFPGYIIAYSFHFIINIINIVPIKWRKMARIIILRRHLNQFQP